MMMMMMMMIMMAAAANGDFMMVILSVVALGKWSYLSGLPVVCHLTVKLRSNT